MTLLNKKQGALVLAFDDYGGENWLKADAVFKKYDAHVTFFVCGEITEERADVMKKLRAAGHTIGLHGLHHRDAAPLPEDIPDMETYFRQQVQPQLDACEKAGLTGIRCFGYPNNRRDETSDARLFEVFDYLRAGLGPASQTVYLPVSELPEKIVLRGGCIGKYYDTDLDVVKTQIRQAAESNSLILFTSHDIFPDAPRVHMPTEWLEIILQTASELNMAVVGMDELKDLN